MQKVYFHVYALNSVVKVFFMIIIQRIIDLSIWIKIALCKHIVDLTMNKKSLNKCHFYSFSPIQTDRVSQGRLLKLFTWKHAHAFQ